MSHPSTLEPPPENPTEPIRLELLEIEGFRGIKKAKIPLGDIKVLIGANGIGKSTILSALDFLEKLSDGTNERAVSEFGGTDFLFYSGLKVTQEASIQLSFSFLYLETVVLAMRFRRADLKKIDFLETMTIFSAGTRLYGVENFIAHNKNTESHLKTTELKLHATHFGKVQDLSRNSRAYHLSDTSKFARIRQQSLLNDNKYLKSDGGNLAAWLYRFKYNESERFAFFERLVARVVPNFLRFELEPDRLNDTLIALEYRDTRHDLLLSATHLSDGSIRFIALASLLMFRPPPLIVIDEPELALHPSALRLLVDLIREASLESQLVIATQSADFVSQFEAHEVLVIERDESSEETIAKQFSAQELEAWLEDYSLGELWLKNVLGGQP
jgi:predicted ATPase